MTTDKPQQAEQREQFEREFAEWIAELERQIESTRRSEILTAEDYGVVINVR